MKQNITIHLTEQIEELLEARIAELSKDYRAVIQAGDNVSPCFAVRDLLAQGLTRTLREEGYTLERASSGKGTRRLAVRVPRSILLVIEHVAKQYEFTTHATLRALIVAGASS